MVVDGEYDAVGIGITPGSGAFRIVFWIISLGMFPQRPKPQQPGFCEQFQVDAGFLGVAPKVGSILGRTVADGKAVKRIGVETPVLQKGAGHRIVQEPGLGVFKDGAEPVLLGFLHSQLFGPLGIQILPLHLDAFIPGDLFDGLLEADLPVAGDEGQGIPAMAGGEVPPEVFHRVDGKGWRLLARPG